MEKFFTYFHPEHYDLNFDINSDKTQVSGHVVITGTAVHKTIKLHAVGMDISAVTINKKAANFSYKDGVLTINRVELGALEAAIEYTAPITTNMEGVYLSTYRWRDEEKKIVATQFESHYARQCFPCIDEPMAKATFSLTLTASKDDTLLANMPVLSETVDEERKSAIFETTPRMSTYLLAFAVGEFVAFETYSENGVKITTYAGLNQKTEDLELAGEFAGEVLDFYGDRFKTEFPLPKLDLLALPDFEAGAMENWGLVTFREIALLANEHSSLEQKLYVYIVVAHELAHMWFGDLVTMAWWDDLWLNESFANLMEIYATAKLRPETRAWDEFYTGSVLPALRRDCLLGVQPVKVEVRNVEDIANLFDGAIVYSKGARLLLMLMREMGEEAFFAGLADYFKKHKYFNTVADDLWIALDKYAEFDVRRFMTPWLTKAGYPVVTGDGEDIIEQERFLISGSDKESRYPILSLRDDLSGHYLILLDKEQLSKKLQTVEQLNEEQRLRLLLDQKLLAKTKRVASASLLPLIMSFKETKEVVVWEIIASIVADLKIFLQPDSADEDRFRAFIKQLVETNYVRLGVVAKTDDNEEDIKLRSIIMGLMLYTKDEAFMHEVLEKYGEAEIAQVPADLRWIIASTVVRSDTKKVAEYLELYKSTPDAALKRDLSEGMTATLDAPTLTTLLTKLKDGTVRPQDRFGFFFKIARNHVSKKAAFAWMYENWEWICKNEGDKTTPEYPRYLAGLIRDEDEARKFKTFFEPHAKEAILERDLAVAFREIDATMRLIQTDKTEVARYLEENA